MRYIQFYVNSTGYIEGSSPPQFSEEHVKPIERLGSDGVVHCDGRWSLATCIEKAKEHMRSCVHMHDIGFRIMQGSSYSNARPLTELIKYNLLTMDTFK